MQLLVSVVDVLQRALRFTCGFVAKEIRRRVALCYMFAKIPVALHLSKAYMFLLKSFELYVSLVL